MASISAISAAEIAQPRAPRFSVTSAGSRKPTSAVPTTGLLKVQRSANCGRVLSYVAARRFEIVDGPRVARKMLGAEQGAEQVEVAEHAAARAPVALLELHAGVKGAAEHAVGERAVGHHADFLGRAVWEDLGLHAPVEHVPAVL